MEWRYIARPKEMEKRRIELGFTIERMAKVLNISENHIKNFEKVGLRTRVTYELAEEISWFLHCEVSDIAYEWD